MRADSLSAAGYQALFQLGDFDRRFEKAEHVLCPDAFNKGCMGCILPGGCEQDTPCSKQCGFGQFWSRGLRAELVASDGDIKPGVNSVWLKQV